MSEVIYLSNVRLSFPNITAPKAFEEEIGRAHV